MSLNILGVRMNAVMKTVRRTVSQFLKAEFLRNLPF